MWRGAVQFGLVTIPVKLYLATEAKAGLSFNLLHKTCLTRVQLKTYCPFDDEYISRTDTVRGYEYAKNQYVVITDEDMESVPLKTVRSIEIELFVDANAGDNHGSRFVKSAYYLEPDPVGRKAFYLLKQVLREEGLSAICKIVIKDREVLAALDPYSKTMLLTTLHWPDEIRALDELELPEEEQSFKPAELSMAKNLVTAMKGEFNAADYHDDYREALLGVIEAKLDGKEVVHVEPTAEAPKLVDLMAVLEASVAAAKQGRAEAPAAKASASGSASAPEPEAKPASATRAKASSTKASAAKASAAKGTTAKAKAAEAAEADEEAAEETPVARARKRKSA
jgi:DNA end-binding protein Ku